MAVLPKVDVCIVGLGAAGSVVAKELSTAGMKVVGLELGPLRRTRDFQWDHDELRYQVRQELLQPKINEAPMQYRPNAQTESSPGVPWTIAVGVGGGTIHYGTWNWRMLPHHFRIHSDTIEQYGENALPEGSSIVDWPLTYNDLEPFYEKVDVEIGISGKAGNVKGQIKSGGNPFEGSRNLEYPLAPLMQTTFSRMFAPAANDLGYSPFPTPAGIISSDYDGRPGCDYCGFCTGYGCHNGAKSSTMVSVIPKAVASGNFEMRLNCRAMGVNYSGDRATSVTYLDAGGVEQVQPANLIILSCYTWEIVRLMLVSGINQNNMVGKYFMSHQYELVNGIFEDIVTNPSAGQTGGNTSIDDFNGDNFDHSGLGFIEGASITALGGNTQAIVGTSSLAPANFQNVSRRSNWGNDYKAFIKKYFRRTGSFIAQLPNLPYEANYLDLHPSVKDSRGVPVLRVTYDGYENEKAAGAFLQDKMEEILLQMGASSTIRGPLTMPPWNNHEVGGCRMGDDPSLSVTNRYMQSHQLGNLFIASGAVFPTYFGYNPTHTIEALSFWCSDYIKGESVSGGSLTKYF